MRVAPLTVAIANVDTGRAMAPGGLLLILVVGGMVAGRMVAGWVVVGGMVTVEMMVV